MTIRDFKKTHPDIYKDLMSRRNSDVDDTAPISGSFTFSDQKDNNDGTFWYALHNGETNKWYEYFCGSKPKYKISEKVRNVEGGLQTCDRSLTGGEISSSVRSGLNTVEAIQYSKTYGTFFYELEKSGNMISEEGLASARIGEEPVAEKSSDQEMLDELNRRFPMGSKYRCAFDVSIERSGLIICTVEYPARKRESGNYEMGDGFVWYQGSWAEPISSSKPETMKKYYSNKKIIEAGVSLSAYTLKDGKWPLYHVDGSKSPHTTDREDSERRIEAVKGDTIVISGFVVNCAKISDVFHIDIDGKPLSFAESAEVESSNVAIAKRDYPVGSSFYSAHLSSKDCDHICYVNEGDTWEESGSGNIELRNSKKNTTSNKHGWTQLVYLASSSKWAEHAEKSKEIDDMIGRTFTIAKTSSYYGHQSHDGDKLRVFTIKSSTSVGSYRSESRDGYSNSYKLHDMVFVDVTDSISFRDGTAVPVCHDGTSGMWHDHQETDKPWYDDGKPRIVKGEPPIKKSYKFVPVKLEPVKNRNL